MNDTRNNRCLTPEEWKTRLESALENNGIATLKSQDLTVAAMKQSVGGPDQPLHPDDIPDNPQCGGYSVIGTTNIVGSTDPQTAYVIAAFRVVDKDAALDHIKQNLAASMASGAPSSAQLTVVTIQGIPVYALTSSTNTKAQAYFFAVYNTVFVMGAVNGDTTTAQNVVASLIQEFR